MVEEFREIDDRECAMELSNEKQYGERIKRLKRLFLLLKGIQRFFFL